MRKKLWRLIKRAAPWAAGIAALAFIGYRISLHVRYGGTFADEDACRTAPAEFVGITVNAGLAPGAVSLSTPRTPVFAKAMGEWRTADAVCFQEVWKEDAMKAVVDALALPADHVYRVDTRGLHEEPGEDVCTHKQLDTVLPCIRKKCANEPVEEQALCAVRKCKIRLAEMRFLAKRCLNCLVATVGLPMDEVVSTCTSRGGRSRWYDGENGVILASKWPLRDVEYIDLPASGANRIALFATIDHPKLGKVELACTHTSSAQAVAPTDARFKTWEDEQIEQIRIISDRLRARGPDRPQVFLADLNAGPRLSVGTEAESQRAWDRTMAEGFACGEVATRAFPCSVCDDNTLRDGEVGRVLDHVLIRNAPRLDYQCAHRILQDPVPVIGYDGQTVLSHPSDHCGVVSKYRIK